LGYSSTAQYYAIKDIEEATSYFQHEVLGSRLIEICGELLKLKSSDAAEIFGFPDNLKLHSCVTLFAKVSPTNPIFQAILDKFFDGEADKKTLEILKNTEV
jgi:uncharacterized protein (DUF1810 family)